MKIVSICVILSALSGAAVAQLERTVKPIFNPAQELQAMQLVPVCRPGSLVGVSGTRFVCQDNLKLKFTWERSVKCSGQDCAVTQPSAEQFCVDKGYTGYIDYTEYRFRSEGNNWVNVWIEGRGWVYAPSRSYGGKRLTDVRCYKFGAE